MEQLSHVDDQGRVSMVDVTTKKPLHRTATARGFIRLQENTVKLIGENLIKKGDVLTVAEIAGITAAKRTWDLIPLCHPLPLSHVKVRATLEKSGVLVQATVTCLGNTGVEMEALTAVNIALLTVYDMCKAVDKTMVMENITLVEKVKHEPI